MGLPPGVMVLVQQVMHGAFKSGWTTVEDRAVLFILGAQRDQGWLLVMDLPLDTSAVTLYYVINRLNHLRAFFVECSGTNKDSIAARQAG